MGEAPLERGVLLDLHHVLDADGDQTLEEASIACLRDQGPFGANSDDDAVDPSALCGERLMRTRALDWVARPSRSALLTLDAMWQTE